MMVKGQYSEVFLKFSDQSRVIKIEPSRTDYWICTTDPDDTQTEMKIRQAHPEYTELQLLEALSTAVPEGETQTEVKK